MVTVLEGSGECEIDGVVRPVKLFDTTFVPGGLVHCFRNTGDGPMKIMWVYATGHVTRTFAATGETVEHLTEADKIAGR
jgi:mannose-6-phosphate isomerase-like protein (cupin superfamily)